MHLRDIVSDVVNAQLVREVADYWIEQADAKVKEIEKQIIESVVNQDKIDTTTINDLRHKLPVIKSLIGHLTTNPSDVQSYEFSIIGFNSEEVVATSTRIACKAYNKLKSGLATGEFIEKPISSIVLPSDTTIIPSGTICSISTTFGGEGGEMIAQNIANNLTKKGITA